VFAEVEQGQAKREGEQHGFVRPGYLRQDAFGSSQVQAGHSVRIV